MTATGTNPTSPVARSAPDEGVHLDRAGRIVAAIDEQPTSAAVLRTAQRLGDLLGLEVVAVHVQQRADRRAVTAALATHARARLEVVGPGEPGEVLAGLAATGRDLVVLGSRALDLGGAGLGSVPRAVIRRARTPVVLVPPVPRTDDPIDRILVPLDDDPRVTAAVGPVVAWLEAAGCRIIGLHVFAADTVPACLDHPGHGAGAWRRSFALRHGLGDAVTGRGVPGPRILRAVEEHAADLVVVGWRQRLEGRRAPVVRALLSACRIPVLLVPLEGSVEQ